jgi:hypothetical protein
VPRRRCSHAFANLWKDQATETAAHELTRIAEATARNPRPLKRLALRTAHQAADRYTQSLPPHQLQHLTADRTKRVTTDEAHLLEVVMEALDMVQEALSDRNGLATLLWNRSASAASSSWWPMWEEDFSDLVMGLLKLHLEQRRVIHNREVQVNRSGVDGAGRTDIHVQAATAPDDPTPFTVVIECKGCWNDSLGTALESQLVTRYLQHRRQPARRLLRLRPLGPRAANTLFISTHPEADRTRSTTESRRPEGDRYREGLGLQTPGSTNKLTDRPCPWTSASSSRPRHNCFLSRS